MHCGDNKDKINVTEFFQIVSLVYVCIFCNMFLRAYVSPGIIILLTQVNESIPSKQTPLLTQGSNRSHSSISSAHNVP